jgi:hypothetical protein
MFPATGSTITHAISGPQRSNAADTAATALNGACTVSSLNAGGTPGEPGMPSVATPLPAPTSNASACPW